MLKKIADYIFDNDDRSLPIVFIILFCTGALLAGVLIFSYKFIGMSAQERKRINARMEERVAKIAELETAISTARTSLDKSSGNIHAWKILTDSQAEYITLLRENLNDSDKKASNMLSEIMFIEGMSRNMEYRYRHIDLSR